MKEQTPQAGDKSEEFFPNWVGNVNIQEGIAAFINGTFSDNDQQLSVDVFDKQKHEPIQIDNVWLYKDRVFQYKNFALLPEIAFKNIKNYYYALNALLIYIEQDNPWKIIDVSAGMDGRIRENARTDINNFSEYLKLKEHFLIIVNEELKSLEEASDPNIPKFKIPILEEIASRLPPIPESHVHIVKIFKIKNFFNIADDVLMENKFIWDKLLYITEENIGRLTSEIMGDPLNDTADYIESQENSGNVVVRQAMRFNRVCDSYHKLVIPDNILAIQKIRRGIESEIRKEILKATEDQRLEAASRISEKAYRIFKI